MPGHKFNGGDYRYGYQDSEMDNEVKGEGNSVNYKYKMHDPRLGRFFAVDSLAPEYPHNSPYAFSENRDIDTVELEGLEKSIIHDDFENHLVFNIIYSSELLTDIWEEVNDPNVKVEVHYEFDETRKKDKAIATTSLNNFGALASWYQDQVLFMNSLTEEQEKDYVNSISAEYDFKLMGQIEKLFADTNLNIKDVSGKDKQGIRTMVVIIDNSYKSSTNMSDVDLKVVTKAFIHEVEAH